MSSLPSANPRIVEALYAEALALADRARAQFGQLRSGGAEDRLRGGAELAQVQASCEALRTTTRIMHCLAWLLNHRAWFAGELTEQQLRRHGRLIAHFPASDAAAVDLLPPPAQHVVHDSERLYQRIDRLAEAWQGGVAVPAQPRESAIARLRERLDRAMAQAS